MRVAFRAMAADNAITVDSNDEPRARYAIDVAIADVRRIEAKYSRYRDDSVTSSINRAAGNEAVAIDAETSALLHYAGRCHTLSEGRFDITAGVLRRAWDFRRVPPQLPDAETIDALRERIGWEHVEVSECCVRLRKPGMEVDFGGIGKEYAADRAATILQEHGLPHALVDLGGDVRAVGGQADGSAWRIAIRHPRAPEPAVTAAVELHDGAIATSGDYERFFEIHGRRYCHLLDARSGWPVRAWQSMSVAAPLAVVAGSCATIAMLLQAGAAPFLDRQGFAWLGVDAQGNTRGSGSLSAEVP